MKILVTVPTYNEAENIISLLRDIRRFLPGADILVIDDNSPDGTARLVEDSAREDPRIHLLLRTTERGRGSAGRDGFLWGLQAGAGVLIEMDADYSHHPRYLPELVAGLELAPVVLGSRQVPGGGETGRGPARRLVTALAGAFIRAVLGVTVRDPTSGYRAFRREVLAAIRLEKLISTGPSIVSEILYKAHLQGFAMTEVPILFEDRRAGSSKLDFRTLLRTLGMVLRLRRLHRAGVF